MPILIAIVVLGFLAGRLAARPVALACTAVLAVLANVSFAWSIADGKGDDPWWLILLSIAGAAVAFGAAELGARLRRRVAVS